MSVSLICVALLALLCLLLGFYVSLCRARSRTNYGVSDEPDNALYKAHRAHGNTIEYAPILALLIYILRQGVPAAWVTWTMVIVTFCRYLYVAGILIPQTMAVPNPMRFLGSLGTYLGGLVLVGALLMRTSAL